LEDSKLNPEKNNSIEPTLDSIQQNKEVNEENKKKENVKAFTDFLEKASNQDSSEEKVNIDYDKEKLKKTDNSLFKRFLNNGFDAFQLIQTIKCWHY